jgi:hypothetical protein
MHASDALISADSGVGRAPGYALGGKQCNRSGATVGGYLGDRAGMRAITERGFQRYRGDIPGRLRSSKQPVARSTPPSCTACML